MHIFNKITFLVILAFSFATTLAMTGCSDDEETASEMPGARLVNTIGHYNVVKFNGSVYGVPHGVSIDWQKDDLKKVPGMIIESSVDKVEQSIRSLPSQNEPASLPSSAKLIKVVGRYNIVTFNDKVYGAPHGVAINWEKDDLQKVNGMIIGSSVIGVQTSIYGRRISEKLARLTGGN